MVCAVLVSVEKEKKTARVNQTNMPVTFVAGMFVHNSACAESIFDQKII